jgi:hypothetical protein
VRVMSVGCMQSPRYTVIAAVLRDTIKGTLYIIVADLTANSCDAAN